MIGIVQISTAWMLACFPRVLPKKPELNRGNSTLSNEIPKTVKRKPEGRTFKRWQFKKEKSYKMEKNNIYLLT